MFKRKIITKEPANKEKAYEYAVYLLSLSLRTGGELEKKLQEKGYAEGTIHTVLKELKEARYVDDERYAEVYLENLKKYKTFGFYGIKKKLMEKRLQQNIIERVLSEGLGEEEEIKIAKRFLKKQESRSKNQGKIDQEKDNDSNETIYVERVPHSSGKTSSLAMTDKQKLAQKLRARGFSSGVIAKITF